MNEYIYAFLGYMTVIAALGWWFSSKSTSSDDFALGNRSLNYVATAIAAHSSDMSIWLFMGLPAAIFVSGMTAAWIPLGLTLGMYLSWSYVAQPLRTQSEHHKSVTLGSFFSAHFQDKSGAIRALTGLLSLLFFIFYISSGLVGMGLMFESTFKLNYHIGMGIALLTTVAYTLLGGFLAVAWCDLFQGIFLVAAIVLVPILAWFNLPASHCLTTAAQLKNVSLSIMPTSYTELLSALTLAVGWGLGYFGQPHILINFMASEKSASLTKAKWVGMVWQLLTLGAAVAVGLIGIIYFFDCSVSPQLIFITMVQDLFNPLAAGVVLCAIVAAGLTTIDTQILVTASTFAKDLYQPFINPKATEKELLFVTKLGVVLLPCLSFAVAFSKHASVYGLVDYAWSGLGSCFGPVVLVALYGTRKKVSTVIIGMLTAGFIAGVWPLLNIPVQSMIPAFVTNLLILLFL